MLNYNKINELLNNNSDTKESFYKKIGVSQQGFKQTVANQSMKVSTLEKIAEYFKKPMSYFFEGNTANEVPESNYKDKYIECLESNAKLMQQINALEKNTPVPGPTSLPKLK